MKVLIVSDTHKKHENLEKVLEKECLSYSRKACRIVGAELGDRLGDYAALSVAATIGDNER